MNSYKKLITVLVFCTVNIAMCAYGQEAQGKSDEHKFHFAIEPSAGFPFSNARKDVLVIPTSEISSEKLGEITEDMAVMGRILDKQIPERTCQTVCP